MYVMEKAQEWVATHLIGIIVLTIQSVSPKEFRRWTRLPVCWPTDKRYWDEGISALYWANQGQYIYRDMEGYALACLNHTCDCLLLPMTEIDMQDLLERNYEDQHIDFVLIKKDFVTNKYIDRKIVSNLGYNLIDNDGLLVEYDERLTDWRSNL
jgi:hypothetical protein